MKRKRKPRNGMLENQPPGMQGLTLQAPTGLPAVHRITNERVANSGHMNADLVGTAGVQPASHGAMPACIVQNGDIGCRRFAWRLVRVNHGHLEPVSRVTTDREIHMARG